MKHPMIRKLRGLASLGALLLLLVLLLSLSLAPSSASASALRVCQSDTARYAYRMALVAAGAFDVALALTPKWDWDVCAGALIVEEAGGRVTDHHGRPWLFNQADPRQSSLVCSAPALHPLIVRRTAPIPLAPR